MNRRHFFQGLLAAGGVVLGWARLKPQPKVPAVVWRKDTTMLPFPLNVDQDQWIGITPRYSREVPLDTQKALAEWRKHLDLQINPPVILTQQNDILAIHPRRRIETKMPDLNWREPCHKHSYPSA